jgi:hypothetical protein
MTYSFSSTILPEKEPATGYCLVNMVNMVDNINLAKSLKFLHPEQPIYKFSRVKDSQVGVSLILIDFRTGAEELLNKNRILMLLSIFRTSLNTNNL